MVPRKPGISPRRRGDGGFLAGGLAGGEDLHLDRWLARRGEILLQAGRREEARAAYEQALKALDSLPPGRRNVPAMNELEKRIKASLEATRPVSAAN